MISIFTVKDQPADLYYCCVSQVKENVMSSVGFSVNILALVWHPVALTADHHSTVTTTRIVFLKILCYGNIMTSGNNSGDCALKLCYKAATKGLITL